MSRHQYSRIADVALFWVLVFVLSGWGSPHLTAAPTDDMPRSDPVSVAEFSCGDVTEIPQTECEALVALYTATVGPNWTTNYGWLQTNTPCSWMGISCTGGFVTGLNFYNNNLVGIPPAELDNLDHVTWLQLSQNQITGLPDGLGNMAKLQSLQLGSNQLTTVPDTLGNLSQLVQLGLNNNLLISVPASLGGSSDFSTDQSAGLSNLTWLNLSDNLLTTLPPELGNLSSLQYLFVNGNQLTDLPTSLGGLASLLELHLHGNPLTGEMPAFLAGMTLLGSQYWGFGLSPFTFYETGWCVPATGPLPAWLANMMTYAGTGMICGQTAGAITGQVTEQGGAALPGIQVNLYRAMGGVEPHGGGTLNWLPQGQTRTSPDGGYRFDGLGQDIDYRVHFVDPSDTYAPQYYDNKVRAQDSTPVSVTLGSPFTGVNGILDRPHPPLVEINPGNGTVSFNPDGTANIRQTRSQASPIVVTLPITCTGGSAPTDVSLLQDPGNTYPMQAMGGDLYQATIPVNQMHSSTLKATYSCQSQPVEQTVGFVTLYDPSGVITDSITGLPVKGATVTLYKVPGWLPRTGPTDTRPDTCESNVSKASGVPWSQPAPTDLGIMANPELNLIAPAIASQQTDAVGYYGWDVSEGCWYVRVTASGYMDLTSPVVGVPPAVTDLNLVLTPILPIYLPMVVR